MIALVFQVIISMLCGIMVLELAKWLIRYLRDLKTKRECSVYESAMFKQDLAKAYKRSNCKPYNSDIGETVRVYLP